MKLQTNEYQETYTPDVCAERSNERDFGIGIVTRMGENRRFEFL